MAIVYLSDEPRCNDDELIDALRKLEPGKKLVYYRGILNRLRPQERSVADEALRLFSEGRLHLAQRRLDEPILFGVVDRKFGYTRRGFEYVAIGAKNPT